MRGAARVVTEIPHYFAADFISDYEDKARQSSDALRHGQTLLNALKTAPHLDAAGWVERSGWAQPAFAGRGLKANPGNDEQIEDRLREGFITMPLWGVSLDRAIAESYGERFLLEIIGPFPAIASWTHSGIKAEEQELITGGQYTVEDVTGSDTLHVRLRWQRGAC